MSSHFRPIWKPKKSAPDAKLRDAWIVSENRNLRNIALIGFMGTGKSTVGVLTANQLGFRFVDTDTLIERRVGMPISEIFARQGEPAFRALEAQVVEELAEVERTVISTGGGVGANAEHLASLKRHSMVVCLWASARVILDRVRHQSHRPLLQDVNPLDKIERLLQQRSVVYRQADLLLNVNDRCAREVSRQIMHHFHLMALESPKAFLR